MLSNEILRFLSEIEIDIIIKRLKCAIKADITRYPNTYLISARFLGCLRMLPLHDVAL